MRAFPRAFAFVLALIAATALSAHAQNAALQGTYTYDASASDNVKAAIDAAVAKMNFVTRPIARGRLTKTNQPYQKLEIAFTPSQVTVITDSRAPIVTPANGSPIKWTREDGEKFDVSTTWSDGKLVETFKAEDGQRVNTFSLSPDGNVLSMHVTVTSPKLSAPLTYTLRYRRS
jgi:hypothetical protein